MKASSRAKVQRILDSIMNIASLRIVDEVRAEEESKKQREEMGALFPEEARALIKLMHERQESLTETVITLLANTDDLADFRKYVPTVLDLSQESDQGLVIFRDELRTIWECGLRVSSKKRTIADRPASTPVSEKVFQILRAWNKKYPLNDPKYWLISYQTRTFLPTGNNLRAIVANIWFNKRNLFNRCSNPDCRQFFIAKRADQKYCLDENCLKYGGRIRAYKHWKQKKSKRSTKKGGR
jgi:hypothetical protein